MGHDPVLREIALTLAALPAVTVEEVALAPAPPSITFMVGELNSLGVVIYSIEGANLRLHLWTTAPGRPISARANGNAIRYRLSAGDLEPTAAIGRFMALGCYLAWYLYDVGLLTKAGANDLLQKWGGVLV